MVFKLLQYLLSVLLISLIKYLSKVENWASRNFWNRISERQMLFILFWSNNCDIYIAKVFIKFTREKRNKLYIQRDPNGAVMVERPAEVEESFSQAAPLIYH